MVGKKQKKTTSNTSSKLFTPISVSSDSLWGLCVSQGAQHCSYQSGHGRSHHLAPPPPASLPAYCQTKRWKMKMQAPWTASHWDKAGPLLTRPRPSPRILPPTSIDYVVGGRAVSSVFFPCPTISAQPQATPTDVQPSHQTTYLPLTAAFMDVLSSGSDIINDDCHTEWGIFFKNTSFYRQQTDHLGIGFADPVRHRSIWPCKEMREASGPRSR